jgi:hypothetical protein
MVRDIPYESAFGLLTTSRLVAFRVDDYTFLIRPRDDDPKKLTADEQLDLDFAGEYTFARAHLKIESGRVSVAFDGLKARQLRPAVSQS